MDKSHLIALSLGSLGDNVILFTTDIFDRDTLDREMLYDTNPLSLYAKYIKRDAGNAILNT